MCDAFCDCSGIRFDAAGKLLARDFGPHGHTGHNFPSFIASRRDAEAFDSRPGLSE